MAIEYFNSLLGDYYSREQLNRATVTEARRKLRERIGDEKVRFTLSSQRTILQEALSNTVSIANFEFKKLRDYFQANISDALAKKAAYDLSQTQSNKVALVNSIVTLFSGANSEVLVPSVQKIADYDRVVVDTLSFLPSEWATRVAQDIENVAGYTIDKFFSAAVFITSPVTQWLPSLLDLLTGKGKFNITTGTVNLILGFALDTLNFALGVIGGTINLAMTTLYEIVVSPLVAVSNLVGWAFNIVSTGFTGISDAIADDFSQSGREIDFSNYGARTIANLASGLESYISEYGIAGTALDFAYNFGSSIIGGVGNILSDTYNTVIQSDLVRWLGVDKLVEGGTNIVNNAIRFVSDFISNNDVRIAFQEVASLLTSIFPNYRDGVSETDFGSKMESSWIGTPNSFLNNLSSVGVNLMGTTPLDPGTGSNPSGLYGNIMLGAPLTYTRVTDPNNRSMINTFVKDSTFLSLTPGLPKYNGGAFEQTIVGQAVSIFSGNGINRPSTIFNQTDTPDEMVEYLKRNGITSYFADRDKRYYTFRADYEQYFAYLETMLNTLWVKMGLGTAEDGSLNIFSFFNPSSNASDYDSTLRDQYRSSIGFFVNPGGSVSEGLSNQTISSDLASQANNRSDDFQRINYITGMGTSNDARNIMRQVGIAGTQLGTLGSILGQFSTGGESIFSIKGIANLASSVVSFSNSQDVSALVQQFAVTNGMKVIYPEYWNNSSYFKNMTFNFNFVSPYGDPLSIFQYVYVPFFSLLAFAMPRQAAENGLVSPFLVRADMPGIITSDLAMITQIDWVKGGSAGLFTKDKLPRSISGSFTVQDMYPYLSATKRLSFLSANPSFTVFLDNMAGLRALYNDSSDDPYEDYWKKMLNRVNGERDENGLWNSFSQDKRAENGKYVTTYKRQPLGKTISKKAAPWLSKI
jgi:hypothetical protein